MTEQNKEWKVSFELWPIGFPNKTASIVHLTTSKGGSRWASYGSRSPAIFFHKSKGLLVQTTIDDNPNWGGYIQEAKIPLNSFPLLLGTALAIVVVSILCCCLARKNLWTMKCDDGIGGDEEVEIRLEETSYGSRPNTDEEERTNLSGTTAATNNQRAATNVHHQRQTTNQSRSNNAVRPPPSAPRYENIIPTTERAVGESIQVALQPSSRLESSGATSSRPTANNAGIQNYALS